ncbi:MAG TPA: TIGR03364 family FAD-dependent oxidoreductase [Gemmataceae bacterium]|nr:TIGR03364 family FAD-dependent oxidoreductase [Gemmataceae bacterium]
MERFDTAVVGAGIIGLAHAYHLAKKGRRVIVFERSQRAQGASIRNFGMLWPIGQPAGTMYQLARRSLEIWADVLKASGLWHEQTGSLHLAYHKDELQVLEEFVAQAQQENRACSMQTPEQTAKHSGMINRQGLLGGMFSPAEICVDPREVIASLPGWLHKSLGVQFEFGSPVIGYDQPHIHTSRGEWIANQLIVCSGDDFQSLYPEAFVGSGLLLCKLQMMRSQAFGTDVKLGPMLAAGLTLRHYGSFANCPSLPALKRRFDAELPDYGRFGIHVMASQNGRGEIVLGDSHEYGDAIEIFDKQEIDELVLSYLKTFLVVSDLQIVSRWHGFYAKHPTKSFLVLQPAKGVTIVTAVGGAGMTLSFGLAEKVIAEMGK